MKLPKQRSRLPLAEIFIFLLLSATFLQAGSYVFWVNNDYDRWHDVDCNVLGLNCDHEQDDLGPTEIAKLPAYQRVPDCNYVNASGQRVIPCTRDLEDFARLWMAGVTSNLVAALPANSTLTLSWTDYEGEPTIDLFAAADQDGGTGYLTDDAIAAKQTNSVLCPYIGRLGPGQQIQFTKTTWRNSQFIWCGVKYGGGALTLTIADGNTNTLAQTKSYIDLVDIKQLYERWTLGDNARLAPRTVPVLAVEGLGVGASPTQFTPPQDTNTTYILYVHGWNMQTWEKDRFAETAFKRLYWQGYQGRFGSLRWPTGNGFSGPISAVFDAHNYDISESNAWASATGLLNLLTNLNEQYPGKVYLMAHSMGNVVAGEALRLAGATPVVNTYAAMQGAIPAWCYDPTTTNRDLGSYESYTPDRYGHYWTSNSPCYFNGIAGAAHFVNFQNEFDYALSWWQSDQNMKPDLGYGWSGFPGQDVNSFYRGYVLTTPLGFPTNTYEIFAYCDEAHCFALGAQPNVGGAFKVGSAFQQIDLAGSPYVFGSAHKGHSAQFRSDNMLRWYFWEHLMLAYNLMRAQ